MTTTHAYGEEPFYSYDGNEAAFRKAFSDVSHLLVASIAVGIIAGILISGLSAHFIHQAQTTTTVGVISAVEKSTGPLGNFLALFFNNFLVCLLVIFMPWAIQRKWGKWLIYGPTISMGLLIGSVILMVTAQHGVIFTLASLLPHGIFELPAYLISAGFGLMVFRVSDKPGQNGLGLSWKYGIKKLLCLILPLVLAASLVEAYITPVLMSMAL